MSLPDARARRSRIRRFIDPRRERIVISESSINWIKWVVVFVLAIVILFTIAFVHIDNCATAAVAMTLFSVGVAACILLIAAHNRPSPVRSG